MSALLLNYICTLPEISNTCSIIYFLSSKLILSSYGGLCNIITISFFSVITLFLDFSPGKGKNMLYKYIAFLKILAEDILITSEFRIYHNTLFCLLSCCCFTYFLEDRKGKKIISTKYSKTLCNTYCEFSGGKSQLHSAVNAIRFLDGQLRFLFHCGLCFGCQSGCNK